VSELLYLEREKGIQKGLMGEQWFGLAKIFLRGGWAVSRFGQGFLQ
jgi:hypothetical protein